MTLLVKQDLTVKPDEGQTPGDFPWRAVPTFGYGQNAGPQRQWHRLEAGGESQLPPLVGFTACSCKFWTA